MKKLTKQHALSDGLVVYRRLQSDDQDSVRLLTVEDLIAIAQRLTPAEVKEQLLKQIRQTVSDKSWRVRYMAATHFNEVRPLASWPCSSSPFCHQLAEAVGQDLVREELIGHYVQLLKDNEAEVRTAASGQIPGTCFVIGCQRDIDDSLGFSKLLEKEVILLRIVPCVRDLCQDTSQHVRAALATQISGLAPLLGKQHTIEHLLPLFLHLLKDEFPEVRLNIISKLDQVNKGRFRPA